MRPEAILRSIYDQANRADPYPLFAELRRTPVSWTEDAPDQEDPRAANGLAQAAGHEEEASEVYQVGVNDPGQIGLAEVQVALNRRQGDVDDGAVKGVHQHGQADDDEGYPAPSVSFGGRLHQSRCCHLYLLG